MIDLSMSAFTLENPSRCVPVVLAFYRPNNRLIGNMNVRLTDTKSNCQLQP